MHDERAARGPQQRATPTNAEGAEQRDETDRRDDQEAQALGATGVPAVRLADQDFVLVGAQPEAVVLRWLRRAIEARVA